MKGMKKILEVISKIGIIVLSPNFSLFFANVKHAEA